jgi:chromosome partitioning protein
MVKASNLVAAIFAIYNQKGGVGKSSTAVNTVLYASEKYKIRTCIIENDSQMNSTNTLCSAVPRGALVASMLFRPIVPGKHNVVTINPYLDLVPGDKALKKVDSMVSADDTAARRALYHTFRSNVRQLAESGKYDLILIDTPTGAEDRYTAALVAADYCLAPTTLDAYGMDGIADVKASIREVRSLYGNPKLKDLGMMPNKVKPLSKLHIANMAELVAANIKIFPQTVPLRADIENKLNLGKRSPVMLPAVNAMLSAMNLLQTDAKGA